MSVANGSDASAKAGESASVDLSGSHSLVVDISDAVSERDKVKFTVHTRTTIPEFEKTDISVVREHEDFVWLHDSLAENEAYLGYIVPPPPPRPDFEASRDKLQRLGEGEAAMSKDEFGKMKAELEAEYLATFKKTVAMHETFLARLAAHPNFRSDENFRVFLKFESELGVRGKNVKETLSSFFGKLTKSADEVLLSGQKDVDDWFETEKVYLLEYSTLIKEATTKSDRVSRTHKGMADAFIKISTLMDEMAKSEKDSGLDTALLKTAETFEKARKLEARVASDADLKQSDTLRLWSRETTAAKALLYRRARCLANYEAANRNLERARAKAKEVANAEEAQRLACERFEAITELARGELKEMKKRRLQGCAKALVELAELQAKHAKANLALMTAAKASLQP